MAAGAGGRLRRARVLPLGWLSGFAEAEASGPAPGPAPADWELVRPLGSYGLHRCLARVRAQGHGGLPVLVPSADAARLVGPAGLLQPKATTLAE